MSAPHSYQQIDSADIALQDHQDGADAVPIIPSPQSHYMRAKCYWLCILVLVFVVAFAQGYYLSYFLPTGDYMREEIERHDLSNFDVVMHVSDTHIDPYFDPTMSMQPGVCHPCNMSSSVYGNKTWCPAPKTLLPDNNYVKLLNDHEAAFGRYGCNPPYRLWKSLHHQMKKIDHSPKVIIFTGDISPHGYPDDSAKLGPNTTAEDLCQTKFLVTKYMVEDLVRVFPNAKWAYTIGNNDHFPKNEYWQPYTTKYADMLLETGFFTKEQHQQFIQYGSNYIDVDNVRYLSLDMSLFYPDPKGEVNFSNNPKDSVRKKMVDWATTVLEDSRKKGIHVYFVGHQTLVTKFGKDDLDFDLPDFKRLRDVLDIYKDIIRVGLFGHNNLAGMYEVLSQTFSPLFPGMVAPGVSPRGKNQPSFHVLYKDKTTGEVLDFEQWYFDLLKENHAALRQPSSYLGTWRRHDGKIFSWRTMSGQKTYSVETLNTFLKQIPHDPNDFFNFEIWRRGGYVGDETPQSYKCRAMFDREDLMMNCLFKNQDPKCWSSAWLDDAVAAG